MLKAFDDIQSILLERGETMHLSPVDHESHIQRHSPHAYPFLAAFQAGKNEELSGSKTCPINLVALWKTTLLTMLLPR